MLEANSDDETRQTYALLCIQPVKGVALPFTTERLYEGKTSILAKWPELYDGTSRKALILAQILSTRRDSTYFSTDVSTHCVTEAQPGRSPNPLVIFPGNQSQSVLAGGQISWRR